MRVLWLVSITIPAAAAACGLQAKEIGGGWLSGALGGILAAPDAPELTVASVDPRAASLTVCTKDGVSFALVPTGTVENFSMLLKNVQPDLIHIWGTEYAAARAMQQAAQAAGVPVLIGIQGVMTDCAAHLNDGVPKKFLHSCAAQHFIDRHVPGGLLDVNQARFDALAQSEAAVLANARHVTGRTSFDRTAVQKAAPQAAYYACNETLRPEFYTPPMWHARTFGKAPVLLLSQGNYPLKNLHTVLKALPGVLAQYPDVILRVAGWPPLDKGPLLRPVIDWMFPYQTWCKQLIRRLGLQGHVQYTGPLDAAAMRQAYLDADLFLLPSYSENSPNSLGEAMLLGLPCVASVAGGIPYMLQSGVQGILYGTAGDDAALCAAILQVLALPDHGTALGNAAQIRARITHDSAKNAARMIEIYRTVLQKEGAL